MGCLSLWLAGNRRSGTLPLPQVTAAVVRFDSLGLLLENCMSEFPFQAVYECIRIAQANRFDVERTRVLECLQEIKAFAHDASCTHNNYVGIDAPQVSSPAGQVALCDFENAFESLPHRLPDEISKEVDLVFDTF